MGRGVFRHVLALAIGLLVVGLFVAYVGPGRTLAALQSALPGYLLVAFLCYGLFFVARGLRWQLLLRPMAPGLDAVTPTSLTALGWLVSTFVPMKAGDVTRAALVARRTKTSFVSVAGTVVVERALDVAHLAVVASAGLLVAVAHGEALFPPTVARALAIAWGAPIVGLLLLGLVALYLPVERANNFVTRLAARFLVVAHDLRRNPSRLATLVLLSLVSTLCQIGMFAFLFLAFRPFTPLPILLAGIPLFLLSFVVSVTPGNVGTYEAAFVAVFSLLGLDPQELIPMAVAVHVLTITMVCVLGSAGFVLYRLRIQAAASPLPTPEAEP